MLSLRYYLWIGPHVLLAFVFLVSLRRKLYKQLPIFCVFVAFEILQFVVLFGVGRLLTTSSVGIYLWFLLCEAAIEVPLQLAVIYELAHGLIFSRLSLGRILRLGFNCTLAGLLLLAAVASGSLRDISRERLMNIFQILDFSSGLIQTGIMVVLLLFSRALRISWRSRATGVALGFGISACINLAAAALRSGLGRSGFIAVDVTQMVAYHVAVVVWLIYLLLPDRKPEFAGRGLSESDIQLWNQELQRMSWQ